MKKLFAFVMIVSLGFLFYSCSSETILRPSGSAKVNNETAKTQVDGITITSRTESWNGNPEVENYVTPVLVTIKNNSKNPVRISYDKFALVAQNGKRYSALPPFQVSGTIDNPVVYNATPITAPGFAYNNFLIAPYYAEVYPDLDAYDGDYYFDPMYYNNYYGYWSTFQYSLPTPGMITKALPEGVLNKGGSVTGFLYFQKVNSSDVNKVNFQIDLVNPDNGNNFATVDIPFLVKKHK